MLGTLWVVATPLGNLGDFSPRARHALEEADVILAEDTRRAGQLLHLAGIVGKHLVSLHEHNEVERIAEVLTWLRSGQQVAVVSDAGTPLIADPGYRLVAACRVEDIPVVPVPGPCAPVTALMASGLPPYPFVFLGFLPRKEGAARETLQAYAQIRATLVFFERKNRVADTLALAHTVFGEREFCLARELTKKHEQFIYGTLGQPGGGDGELLGEVTVVIGPPREIETSTREEVLAVMASMNHDGPPKDLARRVQARVRGWSVKQIYDVLLERASEAE